ncbi:protein translocase subunit SecD [Bacillus sp. RAR_GA_16]|nr:protein translocase subunit SecD [Bacillus sp. RAR_GA_16]
MVKKGRIVAFFLIVLLLGGLIGTTVMGITKDIKLGLDLQGGFEVLYEVEPAQEGQELNQDLLNSTVSALYKRINVLGVSEPRITIEGDDRIRVQLAGVKDQNQARELLSTQAELTFRTTDDEEKMSGADLKEGAAKVVFDNNQPVVQVTLKKPEQFANITREISQLPPPDNRLVIWLDYEEGDLYKEEVTKPADEQKFISDPAVNQVLSQNTVVISGPPFQLEEAENLKDLLNAGSLPVKLDEIYSTSVGAQFGEQSLDKTVMAGFIGIGLIFLFMLFYYRLPGAIAVVTLSVYIYLILVVFNWMHAVLTLPGIAALILGVGMAVDANIITYERIKEELRSGKSVMSAFKAGGRRSFTTIFDANITTLIAAGVLFAYGTSSVKGFAVMLITSIVVSFLTAVWGSRILLGLWVKSRALNKKPGLFGVKESEIDEL